ncbi:hypothetical protein Y032_0003g1521 [Ancylostoma ceylanicum]|uniref:Uncharacterized protein n=1 Tax=Ancylostoma ceylanicum TaxID=53326 RepID=A0A016VXK1_9BILA|nr:hypothetical protein Y032_0003g1521 [Ancylostoma ceylanicum]
MSVVKHVDNLLSPFLVDKFLEEKLADNLFLDAMMTGNLSTTIWQSHKRLSASSFEAKVADNLFLEFLVRCKGTFDIVLHFRRERFT